MAYGWLLSLGHQEWVSQRMQRDAQNFESDGADAVLPSYLLLVSA